MRYLPDGDQMKAADTFTIEKTGIPSLVLMERAALQIMNVMEKEKTDTTAVLFVCGSGNNGGDGFAAARLLHEKGQNVSVLFAGKEQSLSQECRLQKTVAENLGIPVYTDFTETEYTVIVDAVFGVGLSREITGRYREIIEWMNRRSGTKIAVDIPSGISASDGRVLGMAFRADLTISLGCTKLGCELFPGKKYAGKIIPVSIGIDERCFSDMPDVCFTYDREDLASILPTRCADSHKGTYGRILMITGSAGMSGAAFLSACAAYTAGAGLVRIYTPEQNRIILQQLLPEAVLSCYESYSRDELDSLLDWAGTVCIGCGLGQSEEAEAIVTHVLTHVRVPVVVDADGLNIISRRMDLLKQIQAPCILTPHMAEMSRLTGVPTEQIRNTRLSLLDAFVEKYPVVCVLKDSRTVTAASGHRKFVNLAGNSSMAKAGAGDVLAGLITGLLAQRMDPFEAAAAGVFLHACGGDQAQQEMGSYSVSARDLITGAGRCMALAEKQTEGAKQ